MKNLNRTVEENAPEETLPEASRSFRLARLRLLMKEREDLMTRLVELDYDIWVLEELFRTNNGAEDPLSPFGTAVPKGSLSSHGGDPQR